MVLLNHCVLDNFDALVEIFKMTGQVTDNDLRAAGIVSAITTEDKSRDNLILSSQRAVLLSHEESVKRIQKVNQLKEVKAKSPTKEKKPTKLTLKSIKKINPVSSSTDNARKSARKTTRTEE
jgi:hypothetical protein